MNANTATIRRLTAALAAAAVLPLTTAATFAPRAALAAAQDDDTSAVEKATESHVVPMTVYVGASRSTSETAVSKFSEALGKVAAGFKGRLTGETEVLGWKKEAGAKKKMPMLMRGEGLTYQEHGKTKLEEGSKTEVTVFTVTRAKDNVRVLGFWVETDEVTLLAWSGVEKADGGDNSAAADDSSADTEEKPRKDILPATADDEGAPAPKPAPVKPAAAKPAGGTGGSIAPALGHEWRWTTIHGNYYVDARTGQYAGDGGGMAIHFTFLKNGRYKFFMFFKARPTAGLSSQATTTEEGTITFNNDGTFVTHPEKGWYKGITVGGNIIDRPMGASERKSATYRWKWGTFNGKRVLMIHPGAEEGNYNTFLMAN
jgi:hypothetical protein